MIQETHDLTAAELAAHKKAFGGFNDYPPGWEQITEEAFVKSPFFYEQHHLEEYRQIHRKDAATFYNAKLYFLYDFTGYAIVTQKDALAFFRFGCKHEYGDAREVLKERKLTLGRCDHARYCPKCGHLDVVNSSD